MVGAEDEADIDLDKLDESTLAKLQDYVATCKGVNAKKKAAPISKAQMLGAAKGLAHDNKNKISALHGRGATFGAQPYMDPVMPRPMASVAPVTASRGTGSRLGARDASRCARARSRPRPRRHSSAPSTRPLRPPQPSALARRPRPTRRACACHARPRAAPGGFPMPAQMGAKSASVGGPPRPVGGDDSSDSSEPLAHAAPARTSVLGGRLPLPLGGLKPSGGLGGKGLNAAWGSLAQSKPVGATAPGQSQTWQKAFAARKASVAHEEQV